MTEIEWALNTPSVRQKLVAVVALVLLIGTTAFSQYALASIETAETDIAKLIEAGNAIIIPGGTNQTIDGNMTEIEFLAIQRAQSGSISETNATTYTLELSNVSNETILFSDRPERIVTSVSTSDFIGSWTTGPDSFAVDAPNDALIVEDIQSGQLETGVIESFDPIYDANTNTLTYTITAENGTSIDLPGEFGQSVLVTDVFACGM